MRKAEDRSRYELVDGDDVVGFADYTIDDDRVVLRHTVIDPSRRGQGLGAVLVQAVLDDVRPSGHKVAPACWYVRQFIDGHLEYADLLA